MTTYDPRLQLVDHRRLGIALLTFILLRMLDIQHLSQCMIQMIHRLFHPRLQFQSIHSILTTLLTPLPLILLECIPSLLPNKQSGLELVMCSAGPFPVAGMTTICNRTFRIRQYGAHRLHLRNQSQGTLRSLSYLSSKLCRERCISTFCFDFHRSISHEWLVFSRRQI